MKESRQDVRDDPGGIPDVISGVIRVRILEGEINEEIPGGMPDGIPETIPEGILEEVYETNLEIIPTKSWEQLMKESRETLLIELQ